MKEEERGGEEKEKARTGARRRGKNYSTGIKQST